MIAQEHPHAPGVTLVIGTDRAAVVRRLRETGYRVTIPRLAVVDAVFAATASFSAEELYGQMPCALGVGRATVFRTLELLERLGYLRQLFDGAGVKRFLPATPGHHHYLVCVQCRRAVEFGDCTVDGLAATLAVQTRFQIHGHHLEVYGVCPDCQLRA